MADGTLISGQKGFQWLVDDQGRAHVVIKADETAATAVTNTARYDQVNDNLAYAGEAVVGSDPAAAVWQITRLTFNAEGDVTVEYADSDANFDNVWNDRATLSYG